LQSMFITVHQTSGDARYCDVETYHFCESRVYRDIK
jgi:hypothetical protein